MAIRKERILYEDDTLLAVTKLGGELVVAGKGRMDKLPLLNFLKDDYPGISPLHRLDFETSGVIVFAKRKGIVEKVIDSRFDGWRKIYLALALDPFEKPKGVIDSPLPARSGNGTVDCQTKYVVKETFKGCCLVEAEIERGQFHQIRRHFASIKHPLLLDEVYGNKALNRLFTKEFKYSRFFLHASKVIFPHPLTGAMLTIESPMPRQFADVLDQLRKRK